MLQKLLPLLSFVDMPAAAAPVANLPATRRRPTPTSTPSKCRCLTDTLGAGLLRGAEGSAVHREHRSGQERDHFWGSGQAEGKQGCRAPYHQLQCADAGCGCPGSPGTSSQSLLVMFPPPPPNAPLLQQISAVIAPRAAAQQLCMLLLHSVLLSMGSIRHSLCLRH